MSEASLQQRHSGPSTSPAYPSLPSLSQNGPITAVRCTKLSPTEQSEIGKEAVANDTSFRAAYCVLQTAGGGPLMCGNLVALDCVD